MKMIRALAITAAFGATLAANTAMAQNVGNNAGIWWTPAAGQPSSFTFLNPLTTMYFRIGFLRSFNESPSVSGLGVPLGLALSTPDSWGGVLGIGARLMPVLRYELQMGGIFSERAGLSVFGVPVAGSSVRFASAQLMNNLYVDIAPFFGNNLWGLNPYGFAGVGVAWNTTGDLNIGGPILGTGTSVTRFAWNAGAGVQWQAMRSIILDVNYRYLDVGGFRLNPGGPLPLGANTSRGTAHQIMFSIVVPFSGLVRGFGN